MNNSYILENCGICLSLLDIEYKLDCEHGFHRECILEWLKIQRSCPCCRKIVKLVHLDFLMKIKILLTFIKLFSLEVLNFLNDVIDILNEFNDLDV